MLIQSGKPPVSCRIIERTLHVVRIAVPDPANIALRFTLIYDNGHEAVNCSTISTGEEYVMARYASQKSNSTEITLSSVNATLGDAERWRGGA